MSEKSLSVLDSFSIENVKEEAGDMDDVEIPIKKENTDEYLKPEVKQEEAEFCDSSESYEENSNLPVSEVKLTRLKITEAEDSNDVELTLKREEINLSDCKPTISEECRENYQIAHSNDSCDEIKTSMTEELDYAIMHKKSEELVCKYKCDICAYQTRHKGLLKRHNKAHLSHSKCTICDYQTKYKEDQKRHQKLHLNLEEVEHFTCEMCSYQTKFKNYLRKHEKKHLSCDEVKQHKCEFCDYRNAHLRNLKSHLLVHKNPDETIMYKCDVCQFETKHKRALRIHVLKHLH